jgi:hypothetical protein
MQLGRRVRLIMLTVIFTVFVIVNGVGVVVPGVAGAGNICGDAGMVSPARCTAGGHFDRSVLAGGFIHPSTGDLV